MNIEFRYMYRDCGNWKNQGSVIFGNRHEQSRVDVEQQIMQMIQGDRLIDAETLKLPVLYFREFSYDPQLDHSMHEFIGVSETNRPVDDLDGRDIADVLESMTLASPSSTFSV